MQQQHQRQAGRQPCHQSVQFSSVEFSSVQFSSAAAAAQIASDMSLFIGSSINCRSSSTGVSTIESTAAVQFSSVRSIMTIVPNRFPASALTRSNLIRHTTVNMSAATAVFASTSMPVYVLASVSSNAQTGTLFAINAYNARMWLPQT